MELPEFDIGIERLEVVFLETLRQVKILRPQCQILYISTGASAVTSSCVRFSRPPSDDSQLSVTIYNELGIAKHSTKRWVEWRS